MTKIAWWRTDVPASASARVAAAVADEHLSHGPIASELESRLATAFGTPYAVLAPSGSAALLMTMMALGIGPGDEVIVPNITWIATAHAASMLGATVVLADTRPDLPLLDVDAVAGLITPRTKAICPVHLNGRAVDMTTLNALARRHGIHVVEDACQAAFSRTPQGMLGTLGDAGCFSLGVTKLMTTGQGGVVVTRDPALYEALNVLRFHGVVADPLGRESYRRPGFNFKFSDILAALGIEQLDTVPTRIAHVTRIYERYAEALEALPYLRLLPVNRAGGEVPLWTEVEVPERESLMADLAKDGIQTRRTHPVLDAAAHLGNNPGPFPNAARQSREGLILPCGPAQKMESVEHTIAALRRWRPST